MVDEQHQTDNSPAVSESDSIEELHEEDAAADIDIDQALDGLEAELSAETGTGPSSAASAAVIVQLEQQIADLKAQLDDRASQSMRIAADFENYRKRTSKEKEELESQVTGNTVVELLPVVDNFERAIAD